MDILSCTDCNFVIPLGVMIHSVCVNNKENDLHFHVIIDDSVTESQKDSLISTVGNAGTVSFYLIDISTIKKYLIVKVKNFPVPIYYRLLLAEILPKDIKKMIYLDADIIVRKNLAELWDIDLAGNAIAGVVNQSDAMQFWNRLGYDKDLQYFNSGVLLVNLDYWRIYNITEKLIDYIKNYPDTLEMPDQDTLNVVLKDKKLMLPLKFNVQEGFYRTSAMVPNYTSKELEMTINDPVILHYTKEKPWDDKCKHPLRNVYYEYKKDTLWKDNDFMEHFHYQELEQPLFLKMKIMLARLFFMITKRSETNIEYKNVVLRK